MPTAKKKLGRPKSKDGPIPKAILNKRLRDQRIAAGLSEWRCWVTSEETEVLDETMRQLRGPGK